MTSTKSFPIFSGDVPVVRPGQVWASDITYIRMRRGFVYLVAVMDWFSRYVLSWSVSVTLTCTSALRLSKALAVGRSEIFNTDQGSQFTSREFTGMLLGAGIRVSMDGKGRAFDNIFIERLWRTVKYEEVYLKEYPMCSLACRGCGTTSGSTTSTGPIRHWATRLPPGVPWT